MTQDAGELYNKIVDHLSNKGWEVSRKGHPISLDSQIYHDLGIWGDDFFELVLWIHKEFGVQPMADLRNYVPLEGNSSLVYPIIRKLLGRPEPRYRRLSIRDLTDVIAVGRWPSEIQEHS